MIAVLLLLNSILGLHGLHVPACDMSAFTMIAPYKRGAQSTTNILQERHTNITYVQKVFRFPQDYQREMAVFSMLIAPQENVIAVKCAQPSQQAIVFERGEANLLEWRWSRADTISMIRQLVTALNTLHTASHLVHGDIKPNNVVVVADGTVKLIDFGFGGRFGDLRCGFGTLGFMAPELVPGECQQAALGPAVDWWALGVTAYVLLQREQMADNVPLADLLPIDPVTGRMRDIPNDVPVDIQSLILACLERNPWQRWIRIRSIIPSISPQ